MEKASAQTDKKTYVVGGWKKNTNRNKGNGKQSKHMVSLAAKVVAPHIRVCI